MKRMMKTALPLLLILTLVLTACGTAGNNNKAGNNGTTAGENVKKLKVGMVTDLGSVNDKSFNQSAWEALQQLKKDYGFEVKYQEPKTDADVMPALNQFVKSNYDLTWATAFTLADAITQLSKENPNSMFGIVDSDLVLPNVAAVSFKEQEGAYLVGVVAGLTTKTNKIGFVGGMDIPVIKRFEVGFREGIKAVNPDAKLIVNYTGLFNRVDMGKSAASTMYNGGADIIFHAAGLTGNGVFNEAKERKNKGEKVWVIGVDKDQSLTFGDEVTLTSMIKKVDEAVYQITKSLAEDNFPAGKVTEMGLKENGVDIAPTSSKNVAPEVLAKVEEYRTKIINGDIVVPVK